MVTDDLINSVSINEDKLQPKLVHVDDVPSLKDYDVLFGNSSTHADFHIYISIPWVDCGLVIYRSFW